MSNATLESTQSNETGEESRVSLLDMLNLSAAQTQALADKYNKLSKLQIREIADEMPRANFDSVVEMYVTYIIQKTANDFIFAKMRDRWVADLGLLVPRLMTKDEKLAKATDSAVAKIALEITDEFARKTVLEQCSKVISKSTNRLEAVMCQERLEELFTNAWKA